MSGARLLAAVTLVGALLAAGPAFAHPLGNFSISHYAGIRIDPDVVELRYLIDMAEIPTFQEVQETGLVPQATDASVPAYLARQAALLKGGLVLEVNGRRLDLEVHSTDIIFPPGAGGLPTMKLGILYLALLGSERVGSVNHLGYRDGNFPDRAGWKEVIVVGSRGVAVLRSSVPTKDRSQQLADYPTDLLQSPPQDLEARVAFAVDASAGTVAQGRPTPFEPIRLQPNRQPTPRTAFTELVATSGWGFGIVVMALAVAAVLGAFHALEPGHGKTVVAAYLVGSRGTAGHAVLLGLIVTASHTAGVYLLGGVTFYASQYVVPERLYPWLGVGSGLTVAVLGAILFLRRYVGSDAQQGHHHHHAHSHPGGHAHSHGRFERVHPPGEVQDHGPVATLSLRELVALGVTGGIVPCPAALVVLLSALSLRRVGFGLLLIVAFSLGLAAVLVTLGILMVYARRLMSRFRKEGPLLTRWLPLASSVVITLLGIGIAVQSLISSGILQIRL